ncbi:hypothetical protein FHS78_000754 [Parvibaculum indicum]|uniref:hypothetical protein n=1 Tax=Parvibaculum indicum TaxID=562969 RepID=UPI0014237B6E|nr:hypothetical protein [Parvibaculum indicum]NIJ40484.1 hypothetical protein [Parvibaculum indicum]
MSRTMNGRGRKKPVSRRMPEGWYIAPGMVLGLVFWGFAVYGLLDLLDIVKG